MKTLGVSDSLNTIKLFSQWFNKPQHYNKIWKSSKCEKDLQKHNPTGFSTQTVLPQLNWKTETARKEPFCTCGTDGLLYDL